MRKINLIYLVFFCSFCVLYPIVANKLINFLKQSEAKKCVCVRDNRDIVWKFGEHYSDFYVRFFFFVTKHFSFYRCDGVNFLFSFVFLFLIILFFVCLILLLSVGRTFNLKRKYFVFLLFYD